jgi:ribosome-binding ATPase YchF (GTP1/OBG family)
MYIRMTDAIVHVVRCFVDEDIIHVDGNVDPLRDVEIINLELILADFAQIEKKLEKARKDKFKTTPEELAALEKVIIIYIIILNINIIITIIINIKMIIIIIIRLTTP